MLNKAIRFLTPNYKKLNWKTVFLIVFSVAFFIRFPFFFRDYIDRDESTFIIMAQSWVDGHLPYTHLWDLKPPITFLSFAIVIYTFGKSFFAIRLFGTFLVAITALFIYGIASKSMSKKVSFWCAIFSVFLLSLFGSLQGVMSEHICTMFFVIGVYVLLTKHSLRWFFIAGFLFGISVMSKLNMAYPLLILGLYLSWKAIQEKRILHEFKQLFVMGLGFVTLVLLTAIPYYLEGETSTWWQSVFEAPLAYSSSKHHSVLKPLPFVLVILMLLFAGHAFKIINYKSRHVQIVVVIILGVLLSFIQAGKANGHYLIQLFPFILIPIGIAVDTFPAIPKKFLGGAILLLFLIPIESYLEYANIISNKLEKGTFYNGEGIDVTRYIETNNLETENIFFTEYHIGYWVLGEDPPTKAATHPSSIGREELFPYMKNPRKTGMQELQYILDVVQPKIIVARKGKKIFDKKMIDFNTYIDDYLLEHYRLIKTIDRGLLYQRLE
ncbi:glycosyltransferase family 39 protein [Flagellimonas sp. HMM57]|uniref:ArnT family glycosyltransferase n=1 Tax=unclassified Flagellimonas TaxID=2644544 RepID=UPI0013D1D67C|nr:MULTISPECIES: glycosyltransferase family 39 protein [unclassified Flagellimonas]UII74483.1 glycosyltransferase family 39 protein [Flagellimonas sp. HMM57]